MANISPEEFAEEPEAFKFTEPGDRLIGELVNVSIVKSSFGNNNRYPLLEVRADGGKLYEVHASPTVLVNQFRRIRPQPGEWVSILFKGDAVGATGRSYKDFSLRVARETAAVVDYRELEQSDDEPDDELPDDLY
jgi:hypothetical protein